MTDWWACSEGDGGIIHSDINHSRRRHSCESRNPEKHWIPGRARNDKPYKTYVVMYSFTMIEMLRIYFIFIVTT